MGSGDSATSLAPGFRFHPTDEELVRYYLKRKVCGKPFRFEAIAEIDIYKCEPWDLPGRSKLKSRDLEWYFFSVLDKKYGNGSRTNRATEQGYWKTTGKDRAVHHKCRVAGMKKTLVYHRGRAPHGERTNWVMHEYRLLDEQLEKAGIPLDVFVLCRIFQKSGSGPKNGEQYGAPFIEEEWDDDTMVNVVPGGLAADEVYVGDDAFVERDDLDQNNVEFSSEVAPPPLNFYHEDSSNDVEDSRDLTVQSERDRNAVKNEYILEQNTGANHAAANYFSAEQSVNGAGNMPFVDESYMDAVTNAPFDDGLFLEANDLSEPVEANPSDFDLLEQYIAFSDAEDDIEQYLTFDAVELIGTNVSLSGDLDLTKGNVVGSEEIPSASQLLEAYDVNGPSSSEHCMELSKPKPDIQQPFSKQANHVLGALPAVASEFSTKDMAAWLSAAAQSSSSFHITTGMIRIRNMALSGNALQSPLDKHGNFTVNVVVSFDLPDGVVGSASKMASAFSRAWFCLLFFWVLVFAVGVKAGTCVLAK
ncbi:hypothetical protein Nepgr_009726 [Nepenthes gracilis]|uniref:NAC domain-containing protein n=1 Tax=Nepenthes gracilis TaxID=150966 RepID=A0AAD3SBN0_NEPGR|nr:hypothetical protein Nepgr_009726 [Nepenthes gracilis]